MAERDSLRNGLEYVVAWPLLQGLQWLPLPLARGLAAGLGGLAHAVTPRWRAIADRNLRLAFPEMPEERRGEIVRSVYRNMGRVLLSVARMPRINQVHIGQGLAYEGYEPYDEARKQGRGASGKRDEWNHTSRDANRSPRRPRVCVLGQRAAEACPALQSTGPDG